MESLYVSILNKKWISSGLFQGPFIPLYGIGACILIILSSYISSHFIAFIGGGIIMTSLEYIASLYIEKIFHQKCWDYSQHFCQIHGRICLLYFIIWCFLSDFFIFFIHPFISQYIVINEITLVISVIYIIFILKSFFEKLLKLYYKKSTKKGIVS